MNSQTGPADGNRARLSFASAMAIPALIKSVVGALLVVLIALTWQQLNELQHQQKLSANWEGIQDYAVFYPRLVGDDQEEMETGGDGSAIAQARDLYPVLEASGALYIDAINYRPHTPHMDPNSPWPAPPIRVNTNYLAQYPIKDEAGMPIRIGDDEQDWIVAVPAQFKAREKQFKEYLQTQRTGGERFDGAVQAHERILGEPAPQWLARQEVRIIWMASNQKVFSFDSDVNPGDGNTIIDPVIEVMTDSNSSPVDRLNAITGEMNGPLKVRVAGDPAAVMRELTPLLQQLKLDDNLKHLVTGQTALANEASQVRSAIGWLASFVVAALIVMLALIAVLVFTTSDRLRKVLTVRRLHGMGFVRSYQELLTTLGITWLGQALLIVGITALVGMNSSARGVAASPLESAWRLLVIMATSLVVEALFVLAIATVAERRNTVQRLKEL